MKVKDQISQILEKNGIQNDETVSMLLDLFDTREAEAHRDNIQSSIAALSGEIINFKGKDIHKQISFLRDRIQELEDMSISLRKVDDIPFHSFLEKKNIKDAQTVPEKGVKGLHLNWYQTICMMIDGIKSGYYLIGAHSNVGKTCFLSSLAMDVLKTHKAEIPIVFYTFDDTVEEIVNAMVAFLSKLPRNTIDRQRKSKMDEVTIQGVYKFLINAAHKNKFAIKSFDQIANFYELEKDIKNNLEVDHKTVFFIDGPNNLPGLESESLRVTHIRRSGLILKLAQHCPIFMTHELRKINDKRRPTREDFNESGKYAFDSDVCILLSPEDEALFKKQQNMNVIFDIDKNKNSAYKGAIKQLFRPAEAFFYDASKSEEIYN